MHGSDVNAYLDFGLLFSRGGFTFSPFVALDYVYLHQNQYTEEGAQSVDLMIHSKNSDLLRPEAGLEFSQCWNLSKGIFVADLILSGAYEERFQGKKTKAQFEGTSCVFAVTGLNPSRALGTPSAGISYLLPSHNLAFSLRYDGEFGKNYGSQKGSLEASFKF